MQTILFITLAAFILATIAVCAADDYLCCKQKLLAKPSDPEPEAESLPE